MSISIPKSREPSSDVGSQYVIAADIGGTFTDIAMIDDSGELVVRKVLSSTEDLSEAVVQGASEIVDECNIQFPKVATLIHACTVATNALLEHKGAKTALLTTKGFRDVLELRRIRVPKLYDIKYIKPAPLVPRNLRFEIDERIDAKGQIVRPLRLLEVEHVIDKLRAESIEAVAVCFLHSYIYPEHERQVGALIRDALPDCYVSLSTEILPEIREYERTSTATINSYVGPKVASYISSLADKLNDQGFAGHIQIMQSSGGVIGAPAVIRQPSQIIECGPAAGVVGAAKLANRTGSNGNVITFDMGGTTAKASMVESGVISMTDEYEVGSDLSTSSRLVKGSGYALKVPAIDISEIGAGGGSIVRLDKAGHIRVGPESAGSAPGPCCYSLGGRQATLTDANVVLGYLNPKCLAGGTVPIDRDKSLAALNDQIAEPMSMGVLEAAYAVHEIANLTMMKAIKAVSTYRGRDPRDFSLFAFGGNGGVHGLSLARSLLMKRVIIPPAAGVFSAIGLLVADIRTSVSQAFNCKTDCVDLTQLEATFADLENRTLEQIGYDRGAVDFVRMADLRFAGQAFELAVEVSDKLLSSSVVRKMEIDFEAEHEKTYGHIPQGKRTYQIVKVSVVARKKLSNQQEIRIKNEQTSETLPPKWQREAYFGRDQGMTRTPVIARADLSEKAMQGPVIIEEYDGTTVVPPDASVQLDGGGNMIISLDDVV